MQKNFVEAAGAFSLVRQQNPQSAEAIAACMEEAEVLTELSQYEEAVAAIINLLRGVHDVSLYNDYWMTLDELRSRMVGVGDLMRKRSEYQRAIDLADLLRPVFQPAYSLRLQAATYSDWAQNQAQTLVGASSSPEVMSLYGKAGDTFERLAMVELKSDDYLNIIWSSAENYQKANQIESANRMLKTYLQYETRSRQPRALIAIGKNYIARGDWNSSIEPLQRCLDFYPKSPSCYEVRLLLARAKSELDNLDSAIELLTENLWGHDLSPESPVWKDSCVELGTLMFQRGNRLLAQLKSNPPKDWNTYLQGLQTSHNDLLQGIEQLSEAADRFPNDPRYFHTLYLLAHSYRLAAEMPKIVASNDTTILDSARRQQNQQWRKLMEGSVDEFRRLLTAIQSSTELDPLAPAILRNCYFGEADALVALGRHEEAIVAFKNAASYYVNQPEALEALVQVAECHKKLGRTKDAQRALRQAEQVLQRIPPDHDGRFVSSTRGNRAHWQDVLGRMTKQYN
jgi:tetratricopeptide (TPR) repeat protein